MRGIDTLKGLIYVITPVPPITLEKVDLFLQGFIQIPTSLLQVFDSYAIYLPHQLFISFLIIYFSFSMFSLVSFACEKDYINSCCIFPQYHVLL